MTYVPLSEKPCTRNIISRRTTPHDPKTAKQIACRALMRFARWQWPYLTPEQKEPWAWNDGILFFAEPVERWLELHGPAIVPNGSTDPSTITIGNASALNQGRAVALSFTPSSATSLWGIAILRSTAEIVTPDPYTLIIVFPTKTADPILYLDSPLRKGTYHYRAAACESTGKLGAFSADVSVTVT